MVTILCRRLRGLQLVLWNCYIVFIFGCMFPANAFQILVFFFNSELSSRVVLSVLRRELMLSIGSTGSRLKRRVKCCFYCFKISGSRIHPFSLLLLGYHQKSCTRKTLTSRDMKITQYCRNRWELLIK